MVTWEVRKPLARRTEATRCLELSGFLSMCVICCACWLWISGMNQIFGWQVHGTRTAGGSCDMQWRAVRAVPCASCAFTSLPSGRRLRAGDSVWHRGTQLRGSALDL